MSAAACSAPFFNCAPKAASEPVMGPATPSLNLAGPLSPQPLSPRAKAIASAANVANFMETPSKACGSKPEAACSSETGEKSSPGGPAVQALGLPHEEPVRLVGPWILLDHALGARELVAGGR